MFNCKLSLFLSSSKCDWDITSNLHPKDKEDKAAMTLREMNTDFLLLLTFEKTSNKKATN